MNRLRVGIVAPFLLLVLVASAPTTAAQEWIQLAPTGGPPPVRVSHIAVYAQQTNRMIVFAGRDVCVLPALNDVWVLENANGLGGTPNWTQLSPTGGPPLARDGHSAVLNPTTNRMTAFGGHGCVADPCNFSNFNDVWALTNANGITTIEVELDIKPGSDPNAMNPAKKGLIPVAILTTETFDAQTVSTSTVLFGPAGGSMAHRSAHLEDVDGDGDLDLVLHFRTQETGIACGDTEASLTGETFEGQALQGSDSIVTVGCQ